MTLILIGTIIFSIGFLSGMFYLGKKVEEQAKKGNKKPMIITLSAMLVTLVVGGTMTFASDIKPFETVESTNSETHEWSAEFVQTDKNLIACEGIKVKPFKDEETTQAKYWLSLCEELEKLDNAAPVTDSVK